MDCLLLPLEQTHQFSKFLIDYLKQGHHSLVTPFDWKPNKGGGNQKTNQKKIVTTRWWHLLTGNSLRGGHPLTKPLPLSPLVGDTFWLETRLEPEHCHQVLRQSPLVGDTFWLETPAPPASGSEPNSVTTRWWHLLTGNGLWDQNIGISQVIGHHSLVTPFDWKLERESI